MSLPPYRPTKCSSGSPHRERKRREEDPASSGFSAALHRSPPPPPPALLRRLGVKEPTGVGKVSGRYILFLFFLIIVLIFMK